MSSYLKKDTYYMGKIASDYEVQELAPDMQFIPIPFRIDRIDGGSVHSDEEYIDINDDSVFRDEDGKLNHKDFDIDIMISFGGDFDIDEDELLDNDFEEITDETKLLSLKKEFEEYAQFENDRADYYLSKYC